MLSAIKGLLGSKKFWMVVIGSAIVSGLNQAGVSTDIVAMIAGFFGVGVLGQGMADFGKEAKK